MSMMAHAEPKQPNLPPPRPAPRFWQSRTFWMWSIVIVLALFVCAGLALLWLAHNAEPILRARIVQSLSERFHSRAQLAALHLTFRRGIGLQGEGLVIPVDGADANQSVDASNPPFLRIDSFDFHVSFKSLLESPTHISTVYVREMDIHLPPKGQRPSLANQETGSGKIPFVVDKVICENATLVLETNKPNKVPLEFDIAHLTLTDIEAGKPFHFYAVLTNPKPIGDIASTGEFGPFRVDSPADTPVSGHYAFTHADLGTIKGISGILASTGEYTGQLSKIVVDGQTETPNFALDISGHPMQLNTAFHAVVDGTDGDVDLEPVNARLKNSSFVARGSVTRTKGIPGRNIELQVTMDRANIQDFLDLAFKTVPPIMDGKLAMNTSLSIPPGKQPIPAKIRLKGRFTITDATFSNPSTQQKVDAFSLRAEGHAKEAKSGIPPAESVQSTMSGDFQSGNGQVDISNLRYELPGAQVDLDGKYTMDGNTFDFRGIVRTTAGLSQMTTGWKSIMLKPVDPFFRKHGAGAQIPVKITGTKDEPHFGLDLHDKNNHPASAPQPNR